MKKISILAALLPFLCLTSLACQSDSTAQIRDLITPISLTAGESDTRLIGDLFYATDYRLTFQPHPHIRVEYDDNAGTISLTPQPDFEGMTPLEFEHNGNPYNIPIKSAIEQTHRFQYRPTKRPEQMFVMGSFNQWSRKSLPMTDADGDGIYEITLKFKPGRYQYQFVEDGREFWDPESPEKTDNGFGSFNSVFTISPRHPNKALLHVLGKESTADEIKLSFMYERENQPEALRHANLIALVNNQRIATDDIQISDNRIDIALSKPSLHGNRVVRLAVTQEGQSTRMQTVRLYDGEPIGSDSARFQWEDGVIYALMIDRFHDGDPSNSLPVEHDALSPRVNYLGGDLQGIIGKIEEGYFDSLGVNTLWLSPVNQNTDSAHREWPPPHRYFSAYHGYWPTHHEKVEERFGDLDLLKELVNKAHGRGIKVLLDFISNHVHQDHPFFQQHRNWFGTLDLPDGRKNIRFWDEFRLTTWFEPFLPSFDYLGSEEALETMTDNAIWWLKETGIDGFRHDAVKHVPNSFWRALTRKIKAAQLGRPVYQIGETFGSYELISSYVNNGQLDAQFNFNLYETARRTFLIPEASFKNLDIEMSKSFATYGVNHLMGNIMDSHDKERYMAYADGDLSFNSGNTQEIGWTSPPEVDHASSYEKAKLYLVYMMTIPGVPTLYYGDEIGMTGAADPDNRRMMRFGDELNPLEKEMMGDVREIVNLRREHSALRYGDFQTLWADENCYVYLRSDMNERILVALNKSEEPQTVRIEFPQFYRIKEAINIMNAQEYVVLDDRLSVKIPEIGWVVFKIE